VHTSQSRSPVALNIHLSLSLSIYLSLHTSRMHTRAYVTSTLTSGPQRPGCALQLSRKKPCCTLLSLLALLNVQILTPEELRAIYPGPERLGCALKL
jgi:hypothetical protein